MRCWKTALDQIHEYNAIKAAGTNVPRFPKRKRRSSRGLRQLELQCEERIDLLKALRLSRQEASPGMGSPSAAPETPAQSQEARTSGWIGDGTIPALQYTQLSKPALPRRPSLPPRVSSEQLMAGGGNFGRAPDPSPSSSAIVSATPSIQLLAPGAKLAAIKPREAHYAHYFAI